MTGQAFFCRRCGAQQAPGATFCGRCGAPQLAPAAAVAPVYYYPTASRAAFPPARQYKLSHVAVALALLAILAVATVAVSALAVSRFTGGSHSPCTVNCAPKIVTGLAEPARYVSPAYKFELDYSSAWTVRSQDANGISLGTKLGLVQVLGMRAGEPLTQAMQATLAKLPSARWQDVTQVSDLKGAHLGAQDGVGAVYAANLIGSNSTAQKVRFAIIVATRGGVTVVFFAADPADPKNSPHGMPEGAELDYVCSEFIWPT